MRDIIYKVHNEQADFRKLGEKYNIDPVIAKLIINKGITENEIDKYINPSIKNLHSPFLYDDMDKTVDIILRHIDDNNGLVVVSDYDVDGVCSGFIIADFLKRIGGKVVNIIPDRMTDGYGINNNHVDRALSLGAKLIITTDNGIAATDTVKYAKDSGFDIIVTDHHEVPRDENDGKINYIYPPADCIIDHKMPESKYPFKDMCGAGVAFKVVCALICRINNISFDKFIDIILSSSDGNGFEFNGDIDINIIKEYIQIAALATVCDIVSLTDENRDLVAFGLELMKHTTNLGLRLLMEESGLKAENLSTYHLGFIIGPAINSSGRLENALKPLELLACRDADNARKMASELVTLNNNRKSLMEKSIKKAMEIADEMDDKILVIYLPECHESLAGLVGSRIKDKYYKPVIVFAGEVSKEGIIKGSARSIESYNMYEGLNGCKEYMVKFGGHTMAAGLSIKYEDLQTFRKDINDKAKLTKEDLTEVVMLDCKMPIEYASERLINELSLLEPFGKDNPRPVFGYSGVKVKKIQIFGANSNVLRFNLCSKSGKIVNAVMFGDVMSEVERLREKFGGDEVNRLLEGKDNDIILSFTYYPVINEYMGNRSVQLNITSLII